MMHENTMLDRYDPYEDYEPFDVQVACPLGHETRPVTIYHPSDEHYCTKCGARMPGV
jgi:hypothetical protein